MADGIDAVIEGLARDLGVALKSRGLSAATAESCTGGWVAMAITGVAGSSEWFDRGFVTYSNAAKQEQISVPAATIDAYGAVSAETATAMAQGALRHSRAAIAVAITGVAGPTGGSEQKPVGTVWFGFAARDDRHLARHRRFSGDRTAVRAQAVRYALEGLLGLATGQLPPD